MIRSEEHTSELKEKENLIQTLEEKKSNLKSIQKELNLYKINNPYNAYHKFIKLRSAIYLNETLDTSYFVKKNTLSSTLFSFA